MRSPAAGAREKASGAWRRVASVGMMGGGGGVTMHLDEGRRGLGNVSIVGCRKRIGERLLDRRRCHAV